MAREKSLYKRIGEQILEDYGGLLEGEMLPGERAMAEKYSVKRSTIQYALGPFLKNKYGIYLSRTHQRITQVYGGDMETELLRISSNEPLIRYEGLLYDRKDRLIEYFDNAIIPDNIEFHIRNFA